LRDVAALLAAWRAAERRFEQLDETDPTIREAAVDVARTWLAYHVATGSLADGHVILFADDRRRYVAASPSAGEVLGVDPAKIVEMTIDEIVRPEARDLLDAQWARFILAGELTGTYEWAPGGPAPVTLEFRARANWPVRHVHVSDLVRVTSASAVASGRAAANASWDTVERSREAVEASRQLVKSLRGASPASITPAAPLRGVMAPTVTSGARTRAS
jgi:hypothetical protein